MDCRSIRSFSLGLNAAIDRQLIGRRLSALHQLQTNMDTNDSFVCDDGGMQASGDNSTLFSFLIPG